MICSIVKPRVPASFEALKQAIEQVWTALIKKL
jgi:hypothetical protein